MMRESKFIYRIFPLLAVLPFFAWLGRDMNLDFFYDEVYTLVHYVFVPFKKITVITGVGSGIGHESAIMFVKEGVKVIVVDTN